MNVRLKELRHALNIDQRQLGKSIGLAATTISSIETGYRQLSDRNISIICDTYNVNESWLRDGVGDMFKPSNTSTLVTLKKEYNLTDIEIRLIKHYISLSPNDRAIFTDIITKFSSEND